MHTHVVPSINPEVHPLVAQNSKPRVITNVKLFHCGFYYNRLNQLIIINCLISMVKRLLDKRQRNGGLLPGKDNISVCPPKHPFSTNFSSNNQKKTALTGVQLRAERTSSNLS
jgi:hypothetical protein